MQEVITARHQFLDQGSAAGFEVVCKNYWTQMYQRKAPAKFAPEVEAKSRTFGWFFLSFLAGCSVVLVAHLFTAKR